MKISTCRIMLLLIILGLNFGLLNAQITFTNQNTSLHSDAGVAGSNAGNRSGNSVCVVDINNDGLDDIAKLDNNRYLRIEYQQSGGTFTYQYIGDCGNLNPWGMSMADVDHNGYKDLLYLGGSQAYLFKLNSTGTGFIGGAIVLPNGAIFCQNGNFMDVNNDGWEDIFACNDVNESRIWVNDGTGNFPSEAANTAIPFDVTPGAGPGPTPGDQYDESGNYSSVWTDFDNDGDVDFFIPHCRQFTSPGDVRRTDRLFVNNGDGTYTENGTAYNLNSNEEDWTSSFGDLDNDGDFDVFLTRHNVSSRYFINDGTGNMVSSNTITFGSMPMQAIFEDFDNDAFVDIMISGNAQQRLYRNNGNSTFTQVTNAILGFGANNMLAFATGDLNHDGKVDMYSSYGSTYNNPSGTTDDVYWRNTTANANHYITFILNGTTSTAGALGARIFIYGAWGVQTREVRASESYGTMNTFALHFGLGAATIVDSVVVNWPSGNSDLLLNPAVDQFVTITEQICTLSGVTISYSGATTFCSGDSLQLTAPADVSYSYLWSNGDTTISTYANTTAAYSVIVSTSPTCSATSPTVDVVVDPDETVTVSAGGPTTFCPGGSVILTSSAPAGIVWNTTETTASIVASTPGPYTVTYTGLCQSWSGTLTVSNYSAPAPTTTDDIIPAPGTGTVTATGTSISWYDLAVGGTLLGSGPSYTTPFISVNTTYYAEDAISYGGSTGNLGQVNHAGTNYNGTTYNGYLVFDVTANSTLNSVKVYTDTPGNRTIELRDNADIVITSLVVNIPVDTSVITLNFPLTPGTNYHLGTNDAANTATLGFISPQLMRSTASVSYPYTLAGGAVSITTASAGANYYYFYDWNVTVDPTDICITTRNPATVYITAGVAPVSEFNLIVYPNPTSDFVNVSFTTADDGEAILSVFDMLGKKVCDLNLGVVNGNVIKTISTATYAKGVYNVKLSINGKDYNTRVIVK